MRELYVAFHIKSESSDHYLFCEKVEFSEHGMDVLFETLKRGSDLPCSIDFTESESISNPERRMLESVVNRLYSVEDWG